MSFDLHPNLSKKIHLGDFPLCRVLLENERHYPWVFLVPRQNGISRIIDLSKPDQLQLIEELDFVQKVMWDEFQPTQLNVAAIGNKTPQLHVHVICRRDTDPAWPQTVWDHPVRSPYDESEKDALILKLKALLFPYLKSRLLHSVDQNSF
jgi:diadenosine tetraphosphate (Ap4A) HIT family hydrolase